jgi:hypothetical protein
MRSLRLGGVAVAAFAFAGFGGSAEAADQAPSYKAPPAVASNGFYFWGDGSWQEVNLPNVGLGFRNVAAAVGLPDGGPLFSQPVRVDGYGVRAGFGYILSDPVWGSNTRIEVGAKYVKATGNNGQATVVGGGDLSVLLLNGSGQVAFICAVTFNCSTNSALHTDYQSWEINGRVATDFQNGPLKVTPSVALFGGESRNKQTLSQTFTQFFVANGVVDNTGTYNASSSLTWTDIGVRGGLDVSMPVTNWLTVGVGGYMGLASRHASLTAADVATSTPLGIFNGAGGIAVNRNTADFVANIEGGLNIQPWAMQNVTLRGFAGANLESNVPGLSSPAFTGSVNAPTVRTPAGITFASETSVYAGGGMIVRFP